ncbi:hypothetical protein LCGC14_2532860 [marine sediment metagenome]|uniref:Uncharacterized protein n=1 Tax=marine sediment metagenome TaxID=412755 RepID=A0A0F9D4L3_9ZZZZ
MEQIKGFNKAYQKAKRLGFKDYLCIPHTTWEQAKENFDKGLILKDETLVLMFEQNVGRVLNLKGKKLPYCKSCEQLFSFQEFKSGFKECEFCDREKKDELTELVKKKLEKIKAKEKNGIHN